MFRRSRDSLFLRFRRDLFAGRLYRTYVLLREATITVVLLLRLVLLLAALVRNREVHLSRLGVKGGEEILRSIFFSGVADAHKTW